MEKIRTQDGYISLTDVAYLLGRKVYDWPFMRVEGPDHIRKGIILRQVHKGPPWTLGVWGLDSVIQDYRVWTATTEYIQRYYTSAEYITKYLTEYNLSDLRLGMWATKVSKLHSTPVEKVPCDIYGFINAYSSVILHEAAHKLIQLEALDG